MRILSDAKQGRNRGFTLIELLVVIAIIGILASIVIPNVARYLAKAQVVKAVSEIKNVDTALAGMLSDTGRSSFKDFLRNDPNDVQNLFGLRKLTLLHIEIVNAPDLDSTAAAIREALLFYNDMFYELLRQGRDSDFAKDHLEPKVRQKLGTSYMDIGHDSWGNQYQFWLAATPRGLGLNILRSYRVVPDGLSPNDPDFKQEDAYRWDELTRLAAKVELPGQPPWDDNDYFEAFETNAFGYPAPRDLRAYIFSMGANLRIDAVLPIQLQEAGVPSVEPEFPEFLGGGDDPNNWDNASGWEDAPK